MAISEKNIKLLWAGSAGYCSFRGCGARLRGINAEGEYLITGEMAHIRGEKPGSNRHDADMDSRARNSYDNRILLCPNHHTLIDKPESEEEYTAEVLLAMKEEHEKTIQEQFVAPKLASKAGVAKYVVPIMAKNHAVFTAYGPHSEIARRNPTSDAHKIWLIERVSALLPNNREILNAIELNLHLFDPAEHTVLAVFATHVRGYERWIRDEVSYEGVVRFPGEFAIMMKELANAGGE